MPSCPPWEVLAGTEMPRGEGEGTIPNATPPATVLHPPATILHSDVKRWEQCFIICEGLSHKTVHKPQLSKTMESWKQTQINIHPLLSILPSGQTSSHNLLQCETSFILSVHTIFASMKPVLSWECTQSSPAWNQFYLECARNLRQRETSFILSVHAIFTSVKPVLSWECTQSSPAWNQFYLWSVRVVLTPTVYGTLHRALQKIASWVQPKKKERKKGGEKVYSKSKSPAQVNK